MRAEFIKINDSITLINDANECIYYLVCGDDKALMIDTGFGYDDVMEVARKITNLPIEVVNTHGHCDHVLGNSYCKEAYLHPNDFTICENNYKWLNKNHLVCCPLKQVVEGDVFDLGNLQLEVIQLFGHTPGSIGLLDRKHRILFSGDAVIPNIWLQLDESLSISQYKTNIESQMNKYKDEFDVHLSGHVTEPLPKQSIYNLLQGIDEILRGDTLDDEDCPWLQGTSKLHSYGPDLKYKINYMPNHII